MEGMDNWDLALLGVGCFVAIATLTRLMLSHRNKLLGRLRTEMEQQRNKQRAEQQKSADQKIAEQQKQQAEAKNKQRQAGRGTAA